LTPLCSQVRPPLFSFCVDPGSGQLADVCDIPFVVLEAGLALLHTMYVSLQSSEMSPHYTAPWIRVFSLAVLVPWAASLVNAASFNFSLSPPIQCENLTVNVQGGVPPYQLIILPAGDTLNPEYRSILDLNTTQGLTSLSFQFAYPSGTQFIALMNDATGVGTGGVGVVTTVRLLSQILSRRAD